MNGIQLLVAAAAIATATPAMAQVHSRANNDGIPPGQRPSAGMCRIWIDGVPPGRQPAATDCATAQARRPANARIIYGDDTRSNRRVTTSNGQVVSVNGQNCVQRTDSDGRLRTVCPNDRSIEEQRRIAARTRDEQLRRIQARSERDGEDRAFKDGKGKDKDNDKHKAKKPKGHDGERDRND